MMMMKIINKIANQEKTLSISIDRLGNQNKSFENSKKKQNFDQFHPRYYDKIPYKFLIKLFIDNLKW